MLSARIARMRALSSNASSTVAKVLASTSDPSSIVDQLYLATLSRYPNQTEKALAINYLNGGTLGQRAEDLQFALVNQLEFLLD